MSDIIDGFNIPPKPTTLEDVVNAVKELYPLINRLSTSQLHTVGVLNKINLNLLELVRSNQSDFKLNLKRQEEYEQKREEREKNRENREREEHSENVNLKEQIRDNLNKDSDHQKKVIKAFDELIEASLDNSKWLKDNYTRIIREEIKPLAKEVNKSYTRQTQKFIDANTLDSIGNEVIKNIPGLGLLLGKTPGGPGGHDSIVKQGRKNIYEAHTYDFSQKGKDIFAKNILNKSEFKRYQRAKKTLSSNERKARNTYTGSRGGSSGTRRSSQGSSNYSSVENILREVSTGQATPDSIRFAMERTSSYDVGAMMRLPEAYGGPAIFLANTIREYLGKQPTGNKQITSSGGGLAGEVLKGGIGAILPKLLPWLATAFSPAILIPLLVSAGAISLIGGAVMNYFDKEAKMKQTLISAMPESVSAKLTAAGKDVSKLSVEALRTALIDSGVVIPSSGDPSVDANLKARGIDPEIHKLFEKERGMVNSKLLTTLGITKNSKHTLGREKDERGIVSYYLDGTIPISETDMNYLKSQGKRTGLPNLEATKGGTTYQFHQGGIVPGASNMEIPSVLLGGERVLSHDQNKSIETLLSSMVSGQKELIEEMKRNTKVTDEKQLSVSPISPPTSIDSKIGAW